MPRSRSEINDEALQRDAEPYDWTKSRLTDEQVKEFALGLYKNEIFTEFHIDESYKPQLLPMIFLPLAFGIQDPETRGALQKSPPGMIYARYRDAQGRDQTFPRTFNGYPIFSSCGFLSIEDTDRVHKKYYEVKDAMDAA